MEKRKGKNFRTAKTRFLANRVYMFTLYDTNPDTKDVTLLYRVTERTRTTSYLDRETGKSVEISSNFGGCVYFNQIYARLSNYQTTDEVFDKCRELCRLHKNLSLKITKYMKGL